jgi:hypothetical protein
LSVWRLPPGSEGACRDVSEAYRRIPLHFTQWPAAVVRTSENTFDLDFSVAFGSSSGGGVFGSLADAGTDIFRAKGIGPLSKWVDDHVLLRIRREFLAEFNRRRLECSARIEARGGRHHSGGCFWFGGDLLPDDRVEEFDEDMVFPILDLSFQSPRSAHDGLFTYNLSDVDRISDALGYPWELSKDVPFANKVPFTGFIWDLTQKTVALDSKKQEKYLLAIDTWHTSRTHTLEEVQKLCGKLRHTSLIIPEGRAYLTNLEAMLGIFGDNPHMPRTPPRGTHRDLVWWEQILSCAVLYRSIPGPCEVIDCSAFSDASSGTGVAIVIQGRWRAWRLLPGWKSSERDIGWAEAIGFEFLVRSLIQTGHFSANTHLKVFGDNTGVVEGWWNGRSRNH